RLVTMRVSDAGFEIVRDQHLGDTTEEGERPLMRTDPVRQALRPGGFGEGVVRGAEHRDKDLGSPRLAGLRIHYRHRLAGVINKRTLASTVRLAHHQVHPPGEATVLLAEPAVVKALRVRGLVFLPQQKQGDAFALELAVHRRPVRYRAARRWYRRTRRIQRSLQRRIVQLRRPGYTAQTRPVQVIAHGTLTDADALRDQPLTASGGGQPQNLSNLPHRQPRCWHS